VTAGVQEAQRWVMPNAQLVLRADAPREQWLAARRQGIGGSDASTVLGLNPYSSLLALWLDKQGQLPDRGDTSAAEWGRRLEPLIAEWFTDTTGIPVRRAGLARHRERTWQQVSVDRLTADGGIAEFKTTNWRTEDADVWRDGEVPDHAEVQSQHGLAVTGRDHAHVIVLIDGRNPIHRVVERDQQLIDDITALERAFWHNYVLAEVEPPADGAAATSAALRRRYPTTSEGTSVAGGAAEAALAERLLVAKRAAKDADLLVDELENQLRQTLGDAELLAVQGMVRATLKQNGTFSEKRFAADYPELHRKFVVDQPAFHLASFKEVHPELYARYRARVLRVPTKPKPVKEES
jgi:putative phage-type endonuclease